MDDDEFTVRERATIELANLGTAAEPALRKALQGAASAEARLRAQRLLDGLKKTEPSIEWVATGRCLELLEQLHVPEAGALLRTLAAGDPEARLTQEAKAALARLSRRPAGLP